MDLSKKLNMLAGNSSFNADEDLAGISNSINPIINNEEDDEPFDFNLGELSIDTYPTNGKNSVNWVYGLLFLKSE